MKLIFVIASLLFSTLVFAEGKKVLVVLKSQQAFEVESKKINRKVSRLAQGIITMGTEEMGSISSVTTRIDENLKNINSLILNVNDASDLEKLRNLDSVALVEEEIFHPLPTFNGKIQKRDIASMQTFSKQEFYPNAKTPWGITAVKAPEAWVDAKFGSQARVLVLDTGIDINHPSLKTNIEETKDFVGDNNQPYAVADHVGHGTHVAGTIAGITDHTGFTGVAPQAKILMGRVCSERGCSNLSVAKGIDWGVQKKVDVINLSLGGNMSTPSERMAIETATKAGVAIVAASGNNSSEKVSYPAALPSAIAVGAVDSKLVRGSFSQYGPELAVVAPGVSVVSTVPQGTGTDSEVKVTMNGVAKTVNSTTFEGTRDLSKGVSGEVVDAGYGSADEFSKLTSVAGKIVLIQRGGGIKIMEKINNSIKANAKAILLFNNQPGLVHGSLANPDGSILDVAIAMIEQADGNELSQFVKSGKTAQISIKTVATDFANFDGTSMATPHVVGVVALMKSANKNLTPAQVKEILKKTAKPLGPNTKNEYGSGMVDSVNAVKASLEAK